MTQDEYHFDWLREHGENIRVHGNGFLQLDLPKNQRLHIFGHPELPKQNVSTHIHDHRFAFKSKILKGRLINVVYLSSRISDGKYRMFKSVVNELEDTILQPTEVYLDLKINSVTICEKYDAYLMPEYFFHETFTNEITVTLMEKTFNDPKHEPRVLCHRDQNPDNDFSRYNIDDWSLWAIVKDVLK